MLYTRHHAQCGLSSNPTYSIVRIDLTDSMQLLTSIRNSPKPLLDQASFYRAKLPVPVNIILNKFDYRPTEHSASTFFRYQSRSKEQPNRITNSFQASFMGKIDAQKVTLKYREYLTFCLQQVLFQYIHIERTLSEQH